MGRNVRALIMNYLEDKEGNIFFIPLFLDNNMKENNKIYSKYTFEDKASYAFGRLIKVDSTSGNLIEIFKYIGEIPSHSKIILDSGLLFEPIHIAMAFSKKRWRFIFETENYNKEEDSNYKEICFTLGDRDSPILWKGGFESKISLDEAKKYKRWVIHHPTRIEEAIRSKDYSIII
jgi:hypothetical protein